MSAVMARSRRRRRYGVWGGRALAFGVLARRAARVLRPAPATRSRGPLRIRRLRA